MGTLWDSLKKWQSEVTNFHAGASCDVTSSWSNYKYKWFVRTQDLGKTVGQPRLDSLAVALVKNMTVDSSGQWLVMWPLTRSPEVTTHGHNVGTLVMWGHNAMCPRLYLTLLPPSIVIISVSVWGRRGCTKWSSRQNPRCCLERAHRTAPLNVMSRSTFCSAHLGQRQRNIWI